MGLMLQVTWQLMNLCFIVTAISFPRSSAFGEPLSPESSSPFPSIEAQVPTSGVEHGPFINGSIVQPPIISPTINTPFHELIEGPPPFLSPTQSTALPPQQTHVSAPQFPAQPPDSSIFPSAKPPQHSNPPMATQDPPPLPPSQPPHRSAAPSEPPRASYVPPMAIPQPPTDTLPLASPPLSMEVPQPTSAIPSPPTPSAWAPLFPLPANVSSLASPQPSIAKPPFSSALPLAANPPKSKPELPIVVPPSTPPRPSDIHSPLSPNVSNPSTTLLSPPLTPNVTSPSPLVSPNAPPPISNVNPHASKSPAPDLSTTLPSISPPLPPNVVSPLPSTIPPNLSSTPLQSIPPIKATPSSPIVSSPPPQLIPSIEFAPPPPMTPPFVSSPPELTPPTISSPPPQSTPPIISSPPPELTPPIISSPPPESTPPIISSPPPELTPPIISSPPPELTPPIITSPPPELTPPIISSPPPELTPPIISSPPPELTPPIISSPPPDLTPPIVSSPPPELTPPLISSPPPELTPPIISSPPQLTPPIESTPPQLPPPIISPPPQLITPPSPTTTIIPSNASIPPPSFLPPPRFPSSPPNAPLYASPPIPSHSVSPLPQLTPPHPPSPPYVLPTPPPIELPHIFPPNSPIRPKSIPPQSSLPSPFSIPPLSPPSPVIPSHHLSAPSPSEPVLPRNVPTTPPSSSPRKETRERALPPSRTSPKSSPSSKTLTNVPPPAHQVTPKSHPPSSHEIEAPTEPATLPSPAPTPSKNPIGGRYQSIAPPDRAPYLSPKDEPSPYPGSPEPTVERPDPIAPTPHSFNIPPTSNGSHHWIHHSPAKGPTTPTAPSPSLPEISPVPSSLPKTPLGHSGSPVPSPEIPPSESSTRNTNKPLAPPILSLPPPPPNTDCAYLTCNEPLSNTPPGSPCGCVWPMQVGMRLGVALYTFFPLVSELAREVAAGVSLNTNQVRVMGANATTDEVEKTIVIVNLVPLDKKFDDSFALSIFERFWHKQVVIDKSLFGDYDILYVRYPGLPPSPPMAPADIAIINGMPYSVGDPNKVHPLGVDVTSQRRKHKVNGVIIAAIVFSAVVALLICCFVAWLLVFRHTNREPQLDAIPQAIPSLGRSSGPTGNSIGSGPSSSLSIGSSLPPYTGTAKTLSPSEIEKATDNFSPSRILGEGGFGLVYSGVLEDETQVAVKVLKRDDQQGGREFLAEVEMLSRLHHRNLVKLIAICTDERLRCLVYELIPNGSVESHLHGKDKETAPLDWASRMKIALGAARGLAYLHEDSSPRVIHRDFKSSNILLENDFTPKVSDFGLARAAMDEQNRHISTRVMGTFGYVAPEYAMTGHLLVKSDVYSYGVVLLEILTGRKPVDMLQPPGQENLVAWAKPFLNTREGLELILDPSLGPDIPLDTVAKVAAIASMCVQPEVSHRPFMGEVVQALKLVCDESDDSKGNSSRHGNVSIDFDAKESPLSETRDHSPGQFLDENYIPRIDVEKGMSVSEIFGAPVSNDGRVSDSFRRHSASGPLKTGRGGNFWERIRRSSNGGSVSEHGVMYRLWAGS